MFFGAPRIIKVEEIECESQFGPCQEGLDKDLEKYAGGAYLDTKRALTGYLETQASIDKYALRFFLPGKFVVDVIQKKPEFGVVGAHGEIALVGSRGRVLEYVDTTLLPKLHLASQPPSVGEMVDNQTFFALSILSYDNRLYGAQDANLTNDTLMVKIGGASMIYPLSGDVQKLIGATIIITNEIERPGGNNVLNNSLN